MTVNRAQHGTILCAGGSDILAKYRVSQIMALLEKGQGIKTVARMTGAARNTVRRFQRDIPHKGHHGRAWRAMKANLEAVRKLFGHASGCGGRHQRGAAEPAHAVEVLHAFSSGAPAEQTDKNRTL